MTQADRIVAVAAVLTALVLCLPVQAQTPEIDHWRALAEQGDAEVQYNLGLMYANGDGVRRDYAEAIKWYRKAAEQGHANAHRSLGVVYDNGYGVPEDDVAAYAWFSVAAASGNDMARKNRDSIKGRLTPSQHEKGQTMAREIYERIAKRKAAEAE